MAVTAALVRATGWELQAGDWTEAWRRITKEANYTPE